MSNDVFIISHSSSIATDLSSTVTSPDSRSISEHTTKNQIQSTFSETGKNDSSQVSTIGEATSSSMTGRKGSQKKDIRSNVSIEEIQGSLLTVKQQLNLQRPVFNSITQSLTEYRENLLRFSLYSVNEILNDNHQSTKS